MTPPKPLNMTSDEQRFFDQITYTQAIVEVVVDIVVQVKNDSTSSTVTSSTRPSPSATARDERGAFRRAIRQWGSFTSYDSVRKNSESFDESWLELSHLAKSEKEREFIHQIQKVAPWALRDSDRDELPEVNVIAFEAWRRWSGSEEREFPLATFFRDGRIKDSLPDYLHDLPGLKEATSTHDFKGARKFFAQMAKGEKNPLSKVAMPLEKHLVATAVHSVVNLDDTVALENANGFSLTRDGRIRIDCLGFAQIAHSDLKGIPGLKFTYVTLRKKGGDDSQTMSRATRNPSHSAPTIDPQLSSDVSKSIPSKPSPAHALLLVSDKKGRHLIIDNDKVDSLAKGTDPHKFIQARYAGQFDGYSKRDHYLLPPEGERFIPFSK